MCAQHAVAYIQSFEHLEFFFKLRKKLFPSGIEPETFCVLGRCDNRYTTETH